MLTLLWSLTYIFSLIGLLMTMPESRPFFHLGLLVASAIYLCKHDIVAAIEEKA